LRFVALFPFFWGLAAAFGCGQSTSEKRGELSRISKAIDDVRMAANANKGARLHQLSAARCIHFCELRESCVRAYQRHVGALSLIDEAKKANSEVSVDLLVRAESELKAARPLVEECAALQGELLRNWKS